MPLHFRIYHEERNRMAFLISKEGEREKSSMPESVPLFLLNESSRVYL
jgi:hypothetical protein